MTEKRLSIADHIAQACWDLGVRTAFGVLGDGNLDWTYRFCDLGAKVHQARHEGNAVAMADGAARATGRPAMATVTCGPGLTQTATALATAVRAKSPVVLFAGDVPRHPTSPRDRAQQLDQALFAEAVGAGFVEITDPSSVANKVVNALAAAIEGVPTVLACRTDLQRQKTDAGFRRVAVPTAPAVSPEAPLDNEQLIDVVRTIESKRAPFVLVGRGAVAAGAGRYVREMAVRIGAPIGTTMPVKGYLGSDDFHVDVVGGYGTTLLKRLADETDLLIAVGTSVSAETMADGRLFGDAQLIHIDLDHARNDSQFTDVVRVHADATSALKALLAVLDEYGFSRRDGRRTPELREELERHLASELESDPWPTNDIGVDPRKAIYLIGKRLPSNEVIVSTVGHFGSLPPRYIRGRPDQTWILPYDFGSIGLGLSVAIGAAEGSRRHVTLFEGDGSFLMNVQELDTLRRLDLPVTVAVMNDGALGAEFHQLVRDGRQSDIALIETPSLSDVASSFGVPGIEVTRLEQLEVLKDRSLFGSGPLVLDIKLNKETRLRSHRWARGYDRVETEASSKL